MLDGHDRDGNSFISDEDDYGDEEGEHDQEEEEKLQSVIERLDDETRRRFEAGELDLKDLIGMGLVQDSDYGEEGEEDFQEEEDPSEDSQAPKHKKQKTD